MYRRNHNLTKTIEQYIQKEKITIDTQLQTLLAGKIPENLLASMRYSLFAGGKRLRPILVFASYHSFREDYEKTFRVAAALEMIHTYSLIHDDLPAMDDDDYRRGQLTNHKKFDEATAILAGDALLTYSFQLVATDPLLTDREKVYLIEHLAKASGAEGMVAGQILDMEGEKKQLSLAELEEVHRLKTGKLISFAVDAGAYLAGATAEQLQHLQDFAHYLGLIFQVQDDILDITGDAAKLGKPVGSDLANEKSTYPSLLGIEGAKQQMRLYEEKAKAALANAQVKTTHLADLLTFFQQRDH